MGRIFFTVLFAFFVSVSWVTSARADQSPLTITSAAADPALARVTIHGANFIGGKKTTTQVFLGATLTPLTVLAISDTEITALLPAGIAPGSYLLTVSYGSGNDTNGKSDEFSVALGGVGSPGPQGIQGPAGPAGPQGAMGQTGLVGPIGATGAVGAQGPKGDAGAPGTAGAQGPKGDAGAAGPQGQGFHFLGDYGPLHPADIRAYDVVTFAGSSYVALVDTPSATPDGDLTQWRVFAAGGAQGAQGPQGPIGVTGATGAQGVPGATGAAGSQGAKGDKGDTGSIGPVGAAGATGAQGAKGDTGAQGPQGIQGSAGAPGPQGNAGPTGATGGPGPQGPAGVVDYTKAIANQATVQSGANFNIDGNGVVGGTLTAQSLVSAYDSHWFQVKSDPSFHVPPRNANGEIVLNHNMGFIPTRLMLQQCGALVAPADPNSNCATRVVIAGVDGYKDTGASINPVQTMADLNSIYLAIYPGWWAWGIWSQLNGWTCPVSNDCYTAYYRVMAWR